MIDDLGGGLSVKVDDSCNVVLDLNRPGLCHHVHAVTDVDRMIAALTVAKAAAEVAATKDAR